MAADSARFTQTMEHVRQGLYKAAEITGVGPDAPIITADNGARQSAAVGAFTSIDPLVMIEIARVQQHGDDKYGPDNWRRLPERDHINHALQHIYADAAGDTQDPHLVHALVRLMFALAVRLRPGYYGRDSVADYQGD